MRTATVEIGGKEYWLSFSLESQMTLEALKKAGTEPQGETTKWFFTLLCEELKAGYKWARRNGENPAEPPKDLADMIDPDELGALVPVMLKIMQGDRNVIAKPPKKAEAAPSGG